jgi:hypothetical protein
MGVFNASAQGSYQASLSPPTTESFPSLTAYLDVRDLQGNFFSGLSTADLTVLEDGQSLPLAELKHLHPGTLFVVAVNPGPAMMVRDARGLLRYDYLIQALQTWAERRGGEIGDDLSLLGVGHPEITHLATANLWLAAFLDYQPKVSGAASDLAILERALEVATDPALQPVVGRAVLFITTLPKQEHLAGLTDWVSRAHQQGVRLFVWLVASPGQLNTPSAAQLAETAGQTGGAFFAFSGVEPLPDPENYLQPLRNTYLLTYTSHITTSGVHRLAVRVQTKTIDLVSPVIEFTLNVSPPNVAFVSPPPEIQRPHPAAVSTPGAEPLPQTYKLEILIEFPDGYPRPLQRTTLFVDGKIADENLAPPFEYFSWNLQPYVTSGKHMLKAEVLDTLGLSRASIEVPLMVRVEMPRQTAATMVSRNRSWLIVLILLLAGVGLLVGMIVAGKISPRPLRLARRPRRKPRSPRLLVVSPSLSNEPAAQHPSRWLERLHWPRRPPSQSIVAIFTPLQESVSGNLAIPLPLSEEEITFGRDPAQAVHILHDPSVELLHARLHRLEDGNFFLTDAGSVAGTWVNYSPIPQQGCRLEHGDLVHFGREGFRFTLRAPQHVRQPRIIQQEG